MGVNANPARLFLPIAPELEQFAGDHKLITERFRHGGASWDFSFRHPVAGSAKLQVLPADGEGYLLVAIWTVHDLLERKRMWKQSEIKSVASAPHAVREQLELLLREVLAWDGSDWTRVVAHYSFVSDEVIANGIKRDASLPIPRMPD
jgi:hypothetical protein